MRKIFIFFLLALAIAVQAQEALILGQKQIVSISPDAPIQLLYFADEAQSINITATSLESENPPDAVLWVLDPEQNLLAYADNVADSNNPRIENLYLEGAGEYSIYLDSFNGVSVGEVEVLIEAASPFNEQIEANETGVIVRATLPEDIIYRYEFELKAGDIVTVTAQDIASNLDPYLRILDAENKLLAVNDDHNSADISLDIFDARIVAWAIEIDGIYSFEVRDLLGRAGDFELIIDFVAD